MDKQRRELEMKVLENCRELMQNTVKVHEINKYSKVFYGELAFTATDFCNNMRYIFATENIGQAMSLIRKKHFVALGNVSLALPTKHDPKHQVQLSLQSQNDLKKNAGFQIVKLTDSYNWS